MNGPGSAHGRGTFRPSFGLLLVALCVVGSGLYWLTLPADPAPVAGVPATRSGESAPILEAAPPPVQAAASVALAGATPLAPRPGSPANETDGDLTPDLRSYLNPGEQPSMKDVLDRLHAAGVHTGIGAFSPPDTRPNLVGLAVPADFALPDGYVRHFQTTDDGQDIEPILMYAPDREVLDAAGRPVAIPADRVVRPEQAPPGLPLRRVVIPSPLVPDK